MPARDSRAAPWLAPRGRFAPGARRVAARSAPALGVVVRRGGSACRGLTFAPMTDAAPDAFFSYARSDAAFVLKVAQQLRRLGRRVWVDQLDIPKGARWDEAVEGALRASPCLMVVLSPASVKSQNVLDEVAFALDEKRAVLPILLQPVAVPFRLKRLQYIDFTGDFDAAFEQMVAALDAVVAPASAPDASAVDTPAPPAAARAAPEPPTLRPPAPAPAPAPARAAPAAASPPSTPSSPSSSLPPPSKPVTSASATPTVRRWPLGWLGGAAAGLIVVAYVLLTRDPVAPGATPAVPPPTPTSLTQPPAAPRSDSPAAGPPPPVAQAEAAAVLDEPRIRRFVDDYIAALNRADAAQLLSFYAERVDYFDFKGVGHDFILKDKQSFHKRWPVIDNRLAGDIAVDRSAGDGSASVSYVIRYKVSSPARGDAKAGMARDVLVLRLIQDRPLIVAQRQQALGDRAAN